MAEYQYPVGYVVVVPGTDDIAENRAAVPHSIALRIGEFEGETENGENEEGLLRQFAAWNDAMAYSKIGWSRR